MMPPNSERAYRIFRNSLSFSPLPNTIALCTEYFQRLENGQPLNIWSNTPRHMNFSSFFEAEIFPWQMDQILRKAFNHHCFLGIRNINEWDTFSSIYNSLHRVNNDVWNNDQRDKIWYQLYRISHLQFPWQEKLNSRYLYRYIKIYNSSALTKLVNYKFKTSPKQLFKLAFSLYGYFTSNHTLKGEVDATQLGLPKDVTEHILNSITADFEETSNDCFNKSIPDINFEYRRSLFNQKPLLKLEKNGHENYLICPIPRYLIYRLLDGIYYDLVQLQHKGFANAFGFGFQQYIEDLSTTHLEPKISVIPEVPYGIGKNPVDLILSDDNIDIFVECKARRASYSGITDLTTKQSIDNDLAKISNALSKTYKNIFDGLCGKYEHWKPSDKKQFLIIVFPKNWFSTYPQLSERINTLLQQSLQNNKIPTTISHEIPYEVCSADTYEYFCAVAKQHSLTEIMNKKNSEKYSGWDLRNFLNNQYRSTLDKNLSTIANIDEAFDLILNDDHSASPS